MSTEANQPVAEDELHAYVDGQLPEGRRAAVEAHLARHPEDAARVRAWLAQAAGLRALFAPVLEEPIPAELPTAPRAGFAFGLGGFSAAAAAVLLLCSGGAAGWSARALLAPGGPGPSRPALADSPEELAGQAAVAHAVFSPEVRHPVEVGADQEAHLVAWLSKRLGAPLRPPSLGSLGYDLMGGRLLAGRRGPVAQFMYRDGGGQRLTLYVAVEPGAGADTAFRFSQQGAVQVFSWIDGGFGYGLSGEVPRADLQRAADLVYQQLQASPGPR